MAKPPNKWKKRTIVAVAVVAVLLIVIHFAFPHSEVHYNTVKAENGKLESVVLATGTLRPYREVDVGAQVSGQLKSLKVGLGDHVKKGQLLAEIDPVLSVNDLRVKQSQLDSLKAQKLSDEAQLEKARLEYTRQQTMLAQDATPRQTVEDAKAALSVQQANLAQIKAQINQAEIDVDSAKAKLGYTRIVAPMDGEVVAVVTKQGQTVVASQQAPVILKLADLGTMTVRAQIPEADVIRLHPGQTAYFTILGAPDKRHYGKLRAIEPAPDSYAQSQSGAASTQNNTAVFYNALFDVPNKNGKLRIDMTAQVSFVLQSADKALTIPVAALGDKDKDGLYPVRVLDAAGGVEKRKVRIGIDNNVKAQVLSGVKQGERVVVGGGPATKNDVSASVTVD